MLTNSVIKHNFDLQHPSVLHLSQQLDLLIIKPMEIF
ncbi:Spo0E family sporulation regulatory protein-aspartic acid phosphatase [Priestia megaterium]|uniref:Spo0E family sporulation regulatory protein-aspartic acid phosphatase n=1 Tax=Priestia megaterium TaxID=1404 RepID=A0A6H1P7E2_PRIMG|nr:Spo0E family sporulation regulatory protein-aspartic acid phosphatase [Priestia megaterium]